MTRPVILRTEPESRYAAELRERGGKVVVPYMVDPAREVEMYESRDILAYLAEHYGT